MSANLPVTPRHGDVLILVDVQGDFLPSGSLAGPQGDAVLPPLNRAIAAMQARGLPVFATRDWHPADHCSFQAQGGPWPPHCVAVSRGAAFATALNLPPDAGIISKATRADAYSGFQGTELDRLLRERGVKRLFVVGLATDYCVLNTVQDALKLHYQTLVASKAARTVLAAPAARGASAPKARPPGRDASRYTATARAACSATTC